MGKRDGFAIALAWPETYCKQSGAWYDALADFFKISENYHYKVGHAALVLVDKNGNCLYYDFGRYHAPFGFGRVRSVDTDSELKIYTKAKINEEKIENFSEILTELLHNKNCHGDGKIVGSYASVHFESAKKKAEFMLQNNPWKYGPFVLKGTNCSRFVKSIIISGEPNFWIKSKLNLQYTITASPLLNVFSLKNITTLIPDLETSRPYPKPLKNVLPEPILKPNKYAKWYSGEGAGSWFTIQPKNEETFLVIKQSPSLELESVTEMIIHGKKPVLHYAFELDFPSHSAELCIKQNDNKYRLIKSN